MPFGDSSAGTGPNDLDDQRNLMYGSLLAKNHEGFSRTNSIVSTLPKLDATRMISEGVINALEASPNGLDSVQNRFFMDPKSSTRRERAFEEFQSKAADKSPFPGVKTGLKPSFSSPSERLANAKSRENTSISNLKSFLLQFFRNEKISPVPQLAPHELELLSGVLTRKYGKPFKLR